LLSASRLSFPIGIDERGSLHGFSSWPSPQMNGEAFHLLPDWCSAQRTMDVKALALQLRIPFHYIPAGGRDQFQSLDLLIFRALKSRDRWLFLQQIRDRSPWQSHQTGIGSHAQISMNAPARGNYWRGMGTLYWPRGLTKKVDISRRLYPTSADHLSSPEVLYTNGMNSHIVADSLRASNVYFQKRGESTQFIPNFGSPEFFQIFHSNFENNEWCRSSIHWTEKIIFRWPWTLTGNWRAMLDSIQQFLGNQRNLC
jgi:hypothetical protein